MIGIAMTTYNGEHFLREQIDSILNQTYTDFELIICDDVSSDSTVDILNEYAQKDSRIHIVQNEKNLGFLKNFEKAILICLERGAEYIALSDQDDIWTPDHLSTLLISIQENKTLLAGGLITSYANGQTGDTIIHKDSDSQIEKLQYLLYGSDVISGCCMLIRSSFFRYSLPISNNYFAHDLWFHFIGVLLNSITFINTPITLHRNHLNNVTAPPSLKKRVKRIFDKSLPARYYMISDALNNDLLKKTINNNTLKELKKARRYFRYKNFFIYRLFRPIFFIKRFSFYTATTQRNIFASILRYYLYGF